MIMEIKRSFASVALEVNFPGLQEILISQAHPQFRKTVANIYMHCIHRKTKTFLDCSSMKNNMLSQVSQKSLYTTKCCVF